jgi:hypothetical protein
MTRIGPGWDIVHLTDRVVELRKPDYLYERFTGKPGFVRVRVEPQMTRADAVNRAIALAQKNDEMLALRAAKQLLPTKQALAEYAGKQIRFKPAFATPEDPEVIGAKKA